MVLAPFRKPNSFNNSRNGEKFGIDLVDFMLNTFWTLELANVSQLFTPHENITIPSEAQILFNGLCMRPGVGYAWIQPYLNSTLSMPNLNLFLKLLKEFHFLKGANIISLNFSPYYQSKCLLVNTRVKPQHVPFMP